MSVYDAMLAVLDADPADPADDSTICINQYELSAILEDELGSLLAWRMAKIKSLEAENMALKASLIEQGKTIKQLTDQYDTTITAA